MRIDFFLHDDPNEFERRVLGELARMNALLQELMMGSSEMNAKLDEINTTTNEIAADIQALKAQIGTGMTQADVDAVQQRLDSTASALQAIAAGQ